MSSVEREQCQRRGGDAQREGASACTRLTCEFSCLSLYSLFCDSVCWQCCCRARLLLAVRPACAVDVTLPPLPMRRAFLSFSSAAPLLSLACEGCGRS